MATEEDKKQAQDLVTEYLNLYRQRNLLEEKINFLKEKIVAFSKSTKIKTLIKDKNILHVFYKTRTVFPKSNEKGRKEVEEIMKKSGQWDEVITFDIVKLAQSYDNKKLPDLVRQKLEQWAKQEEVVKIYLKDLEEK